jgi:peptidoglycan/LPS O-acetylase OafA/YrhL
MDKNTKFIRSFKYLPELDALRAVAVIMTLLAHFSPTEIPYMWYGVPIFFTISGFLITSILLQTINRQNGVNKITIIKNFMIRRVLRLFPIYYIFIVTFWLAKNYLHLQLWKDEFTPYFFTYTPNFIIYKIGLGSASCFAHLWSLGVEEQFYLFWPWLILFSSPKLRVPIIVCLILFSLLFITNFFDAGQINVLPFSNFHTLGIGAILACLYTNNNGAINWLKKWRQIIFLVTFCHLVIVLVYFNQSVALWHLYRETSLCACTFSIVLCSIYGWTGLVKYVAQNKQIQYLGTISYGVYLYHMPVPYLCRNFLSKFYPTLYVNQYIFLIICFTITFIVAAISFKFIETPFLKLKQLFN